MITYVVKSEGNNSRVGKDIVWDSIFMRRTFYMFIGIIFATTYIEIAFFFFLDHHE